MTKDEALRLGLWALDSVLANHKGAPVLPWIEARDAIKAALEAKDEPVAWVYPEFWQHLENLNCGTAYRLSGIGRQPLYTTPPQRTWVGLKDDDEIDWDGGDLKSFVKAIEAKLKEKNRDQRTT
jgi:hypothetical protein